MVLLGIDSLLLLFITVSLGIFTLALLEKFFKCPVDANPLGVFLAGLVISTVYFNMVSFWWPVNFYCLIPLFVVSCVVLTVYKQRRVSLTASLKRNFTFLIAPSNLPYFIPVIILLLYYWIIPPINIDSGGYHYSTILWYEKYKVVPGLANVHGRFAFNPVSFIIQAAYSFTGLAGQALYPLNGVLISLFLFWLWGRVIKNKHLASGQPWFVLFLLFARALLLNISSPSSDALYIICLSYAFVKLFDVFQIKNITITATALPIMLLLYAVAAKLAALPALLLLPFVFYLLGKKEKVWPFIPKMFAVLLPVYLTWFCRNVILSGYLIYPIPNIDIFTVDWKAPKDVLALEIIYIKHLSKLFSFDFAYLKTLSFSQWFFKWLYAQLPMYWLPGLVIFLLSLLSPLYWLILYIKNKKLPTLIFVFWVIIYIDIWLWLQTGLEYRFGIAFIAFAMLLPWLYQTVSSSIKTFKPMPVMLAVLMWALTMYYVQQAYLRDSTYAFTIKNCWLYPLKDKRYYQKNDKASFRYTVLNNGVKLYHEDSAHECINTCLPCMIWDYGKIEMRGTKIEDGFRNVQDSVAEHYPFVK
jgi:hypothetical protein